MVNCEISHCAEAAPSSRRSAQTGLPSPPSSTVMVRLSVTSSETKVLSPSVQLSAA